MNIVFLTSEAVPLAKTGGLADVCGALPAALCRAGHDVSVILPAYDSVFAAGLPIRSTDASLAVTMGDGRPVSARVLRTELPGDVPVYLIDQPVYFARGGLYNDAAGDYRDNAARFLFFCRAAIAAVGRLVNGAQILHCNDWQTAPAAGLIHAARREARRRGTDPPRLSTVLTIHNLAYQGHFGVDQFPHTGLPWDDFRLDSFEYYGGMNFLKTGIVTADALTTVSPTYAREIQTPAFGCALDAILRRRSDRLSGILNGIDTDVWNPSTDRHLIAHYDVDSAEDGKRVNKMALQAEVGLPQNGEVPLIGLIGRLAEQKGWDLILPVIRRHTEERRPTQWVVLGSGDPELERQLDEIRREAPGQVAAKIGFDNALAHRIEAASDMFVMPSRYEPCGLNQMYSLQYGTPCVVNPTGGLVDTVTDASDATLGGGTASGFHMRRYSVDGLDETIGRALEVRFHQPAAWSAMIAAGMRSDFSWRRSASQYASLYAETHARAGGMLGDNLSLERVAS